MVPFVLESFFIGTMEGVTLALCLSLSVAYLRSTGRKDQERWVYAAVLTVFLATAGVAMLPVTTQVRDLLVKLVGYVFGLVYLMSLAAMYHATGTKVFGPLERLASRPFVLGTLLFLLATAYFVPDMASSTLYLMDLQRMASGASLPLVSAAFGFLASLGGLSALGRRYGPSLPRITALPQLLLALALIKLLSGGVRGFAELSLIPAVQSGLMKLTHDAVHQLLVMLQVPDHPVLAVTTWNFIALLFGTSAGLWLSLVIFLLPLALFLRRHFGSPIEVPGTLTTGAARRKYVRSVRDARLWSSFPIALFMLFISVTWFLQRGEGAAPRYEPEPVRIVAEGGTLSIPLQAPGRDLLDGRIHKFLVQEKGVDVRLLVLKKPDGTLTVCLDACDICPPDGYAQTRDHVVCLYCNTPIPVGTVGMPGGCNPIPVTALVTDKEIRIPLQETVAKWLAMMVGEGKRGVRR